MFSTSTLSFFFLAPLLAMATPVPRQAVGQLITGGSATYYFQGGVAGSCGTVNPDSALIVAVQAQRYSPALCGRSVKVTNTQNGKSVTATVADRCPSCQNNPNSLDLSVGAFTAIADEAQGIVPIEWEFLN